jgi:hypothetical protein
MATLSLIGSKEFGGRGVLPYGWDMLVVIAFSLIFYYWGVTSGYRSRYLDERETDLNDDVSTYAADRLRGEGLTSVK